MSKIRELIREDSKQVLFGENSIENSYLRTTSRLLIDNGNRALLPSMAIGDIVWNLAMVFDTLDSDVIECEATVTTNGTHVIFEDSDNLKGKYCIVSYLTYKVQI